MMEKIPINTETVRLDQLLKLSGAVPTGGAVKRLLMEHRVFVNGAMETARRKQLSIGDVVTLRLDEGDEDYQAIREE